VEILTGRRLEAGDVREYGAELVVVATGARWAGDGLNFATHEPIPGADASAPHVLTPEQVMLDGKTPPGKRVVVYDGEGYFVAAGIAEKLAGEGFSVELVSGLEKVAPICDQTLEGPMLRQHLHDVGIGQRAGVALTGVEPGRLTATDEFGEALELEADAVVLVTQRLSNEELYLELRADEEALVAEGIEGLYRIGDCVSPRLIADAIYDGHRLGREIDSENPAIPLPYKRERILFEPAALRA
jgi:dimethylamine/trimethylamine dehydrogenase